MNSDRVLLRKYEDDLNVCGFGVVIMGAWSVIRVLIEIFTDVKGTLDLDETDREGFIFTIAMVIAIIAIISFIVMKIHLYIGLNAMRAAKGRKHKKGYFIAAIIILILSILALYSYKDSLQNLDRIDTTIASILVDLTTIYLFIGVITSTVKINKIREKEAEG